MTSEDKSFKPTTWLGKFGCAFRGLYVGIRGQSSFAIHLPIMAGVLIASCVVGVSWAEWYLMILCITVVIAAELCNSALESLALAVTSEYDENVRDTLDIASSVVLVTAFGASAIGIMILFG